MRHAGCIKLCTRHCPGVTPGDLQSTRSTSNSTNGKWQCFDAQQAGHVAVGGPLHTAGQRQQQQTATDAAATNNPPNSLTPHLCGVGVSVSGTHNDRQHTGREGQHDGQGQTIYVPKR